MTTHAYGARLRLTAQDARPLEVRVAGNREAAATPLAWLARAAGVSRERMALSEASPETLKDIGVSPADAAAEAGRPFWDLPKNR